ncbi:hypothetical protein F0L68_39320 [Solihabitans fulvus]|uniref:Uncharacterized protein n=1 Tax=Solihabitans fulvus TaxID=1892852 RepID=A0A5B2WC09_9PSEU|nr:hypothetical protein [Solihabitans fulvus]KAA2249543.1 hypothetical protein F0L68_39320 [Solihabitans fulvus]
MNIPTPSELETALREWSCLFQDPTDNAEHDHEVCQEDAGMRAAEALWRLLVEVRFGGPATTDEVQRQLQALHRSFRRNGEHADG